MNVDSGNVVTERSEANNEAWMAGQSTNPCSSAPRYIVKAESFKAVDETNWRVGSDEPFWIFSSVGTAGTSRTTQTHVFGDVDTGETHSFFSSEGCLWRACGTPDFTPNGLGLSVQLWEKDHGDMSANRAKVEEYFEYAGAIASASGAPAWVTKAVPYVADAVDWIISYLGDDFVDTETFALTPADLASRAPLAGQSGIYSRMFEGAGGQYLLNVRITRVS